MTARIVSCRGPREAERRLLDEIVVALEDSDTARIGQPLRVIVPSGPLRSQVAAAIVRRLGRPAVGIAVGTLHSVALEVLARSGRVANSGDRLFPLAVRRRVREEPALATALGGFADGLGTAVGSVSDLLNAALEPAHESALAERIDEAPASRSERERAKALLRIALGCDRELRREGRPHASRLLLDAAAALEADPSALLPSRAIWVHGLVDATGAAADLVEALLRALDTTFLIGDPRDPGRPDAASPGLLFARHFRERVLAVGGGASVEVDEYVEPESRIEVFEAARPEAEVQRVGDRLRELIDSGAVPERLAIVARRIDDYSLALRRCLGRIGVPFSGADAAVAGGPVCRSAAHWRVLAAERERTPVQGWLSLWLDTQADLSGADRSSLRLAFAALGIARISDAVDFPLAEGGEGKDGALPQPVQQALRAARGPGGEHDTSDLLSALLLRRAIRAAGRAAEIAAKWPAEESCDAQLTLLRRQIGQPSAAEAGGDTTDPCQRAFDELLREVPADLVMSREDFASLVTSALNTVGFEPIGGKGGGVQVLSVMEARGLCFDHVFVLGLDRDVFPRPVNEDPLLPDRIRRALRELLPDLPVKSLGREEERHLFAQLVASSEHVTLCWHRAGAGGEARAVSPLLDRILADRQDIVSAPTSAASPRIAFEHALLAATAVGPAGLEPLLAASLTEAAQTFAGGASKHLHRDGLARSRCAAVGQRDRRAGAGGPLGPGFGFVGTPSGAGAPSDDLRYVTALEATARCPWQLFLERFLGLSPIPDPMAAVNSADRKLLGIAVHQVIEMATRQMLEREGAEVSTSLSDALASSGAPLLWPGDEELESLVASVAASQVAKAGVVPAHRAGAARMLARRVAPLVARLRELDAQTEVSRVLGAELKGSVSVDAVSPAEGEPIEVRFRVDRASLRQGTVVVTDFKSGSPTTQPVKQSTRDSHFLKQVEAGVRLQAVAYAIAVEKQARQGSLQAADSGVGRYLYLAQDVGEEHRERLVLESEETVVDAFTSAVRALDAVWREGAFAPRLLSAPGGSEPSRCSYCSVAEACSRGDSGLRLRLEQWMQAEDRKAESRAESVLRNAWALGGKAGNER